MIPESVDDSKKTNLSTVAYDVICQQRVLKALRMKRKSVSNEKESDVKSFSEAVRLRNRRMSQSQKKALPPLILADDVKKQEFQKADFDGMADLVSPVAKLKSIILSPVKALKQIIFSPVQTMKNIILSPIAASSYLFSPLSHKQSDGARDQIFQGEKFEVEQRIIPRKRGWKMKLERAVDK